MPHAPGVTRKWIACVVLMLCTAACSGIGPDRKLAAIKTFLSGWAIVTPPWPYNWGMGTLAFGSGMAVAAGDRLRVSQEKPSYLELRDDRALAVLGPDTQVVLEAASIYRSITQTRLSMQQGAVYAAVDGPLGKGYLDIRTPMGTASLDKTLGSSAMAVGIDTEAGIVRIACIRGSVTVQAGRTSITLSPGTSIALARNGKEQRVQAFEGQPPEIDPFLWQVVVEHYEP